MTEERNLLKEKDGCDAAKPRAEYKKPVVKKEGNLKKITALSFQPPD